MKILIVGQGGREHALAWKVKQSPGVQVFCAPGNAGTAGLGLNLNIKSSDIAGLLSFARDNRIDLTIVGPEDPLVAGIVDAFEEADLKAFGPRQNAAILEGSKAFTKKFMAKYGVPTAAYRTFSDPAEARDFAKLWLQFPVVIKADGLAAGKGVLICKHQDDLITAIDMIMLQKQFGAAAGQAVVIEEYLEGEEASYIVLVDKYGHVLPLATSQDHKRAWDGDEGPNTGGMGAYSPAPVVTPAVERKVLDEIIYPVVAGMKAEGRPFVGFLYAGLMIKDGQPKVLEFNVRMGDPETQPILARMRSDLVPVILAAIKGDLDGQKIDWDPNPAICVVMASSGYPGSYRKGVVIKGLEEAGQEAIIFHAGTAKNKEGEIVTDGGRVLGVTARSVDFLAAKEKSYRAVGRVRCPNLFNRTDIADRAINR